MLNPDARAVFHPHGRDGAGVLVVDDCLADPAAWLAEAGMLRFQPIGPYYPGVRAPVAPARAQCLVEALTPLIAQHLGAPAPLHECYWSLVTIRPEALAPIQRLPHFDGVEDSRLAILLFLSGTQDSGTAFYRQRATGFEAVTAERYPGFAAALQADVAQHGVPHAAYIDGDTALYEEVARYDARPNRALIYRGNLLHCAVIGRNAPLSRDPAIGRVTINAFLGP